MYALAVSFDLDPSRVDVFKVAVLKNAKTSLAEEPGCRQFDVCFDAARPAEAYLRSKVLPHTKMCGFSTRCINEHLAGTCLEIR